MMREEFEKHVVEFAVHNNLEASTITALSELNSHDYSIIELVYTYHPSIPDVDGKSKIAALFALGGMCVIIDMLPTAEAARDLQLESDKLKSRLLEINQQLLKLKRGVINVNT